MLHVPTVRPLCLLDAQDMADVHRACFPYSWSKDAFIKLLDQKAAFGFMAFHETTPIGFILSQYVIDEAEILTFAVHPHYQRQGFGKLLLTRLIDELRPKGVHTLFLEVSITNPSALKLYHHLGFQQVGTRQGYFSHLSDPTAALLKKDLLP